ncbi:DUF4129 domain-containing protein [Roseibium sp. M-1]
MRRLFLFSILFFLAGSLVQPGAQEAVRTQLEIGESGEAYLNALRLRGIETDVAYFDPSAPPPKLDTKQEPPKPQAPTKSADDPVTTGTWIARLVVLAVLAAIAYLVLRYGGRMAVSLRREGENVDSARAQRSGTPPAWAEKLSSLEEILRMQDRRRALVLLTQKVLATTVAAHGILMQRSWTARDALSHIPDMPGQRDVLRRLVTTCELVQFGGRDVSEEEFRNHVDGCRSLLGAGAR